MAAIRKIAQRNFAAVRSSRQALDIRGESVHPCPRNQPCLVAVAQASLHLPPLRA